MGIDARGGITYTSGAASGSKYSIRTSMGNKPVNYVSWYDAARFINWLHNGQGSGSTETGAYTLSGNTGIITKNVNAKVWLPSEDEWYKAAYYDPIPGAGGGDNYWTYATQTDTQPTVATANATGDVSNPGANVANYNVGAGWNSQNGNVTTVGSGAANNYFGTADMNGNVWEWNDAVIGSERGLRGGSWAVILFALPAPNRASYTPTTEDGNVGFRVASGVNIPVQAEVATAIELFFNSTLGKTYLIEESIDLTVWTPLESGIVGTGNEIVRLYSTRNVPKRFLKVSEVSP